MKPSIKPKSIFETLLVIGLILVIPIIFIMTIQVSKTTHQATNITSTPIFASIQTEIPNKNLLSDCKIITEEGKIYALSDDLIFSWGIREEQIDSTLKSNFPEWAAYRQTVEWSSNPVKISEIVINASWQEQFVINPAVTLVTLGERFNWQLPEDKDIYLESKTINEELNRLWFEWVNPENDQVRSLYPDISNASTYALYIYLDQTAQKIEKWCNSYQTLFKASPLRP